MHCHWRQAVVKCMHSGGIKMFVHLRLLSQEYSTNSELEVWRLVRCFGIGVWKGPFGLVRLPWFGDMLNTNLEHYEVGTRFLIDIDFDMQANSWRYGEISIYIYIFIHSEVATSVPTVLSSPMTDFAASLYQQISGFTKPTRVFNERGYIIQPYQESMIQSAQHPSKHHLIQVMIDIAINNQCRLWSTACYLIFSSLSICWTWFRLGHAFKSLNVLSYKALGWRQVMPIFRSKGDKGDEMTS